MELPLTDEFGGRVAVVTGAGARGDGIGNGRAASLLFAAAGATVVAVDRDVAAAEVTARMIDDAGGRAHVIGGDVTDAEACGRIAGLAAELGGAAVLVNNVGIGRRGTLMGTDPDVWQRVMRINVDSMYHMSRALIPQMAQAGAGAIVNIGSIASMRPRGLTAYSTSKGAVVSLTKAMAVDHGADGIRVNAVLPGPVWTPLVDTPDMTPELRERRRDASLLGVEGTGWDVGHAVVFLASDRARYITGTTLVVDGGTSLGAPRR